MGLQSTHKVLCWDCFYRLCSGVSDNSHIGVHKVYYETRALFSSTKSQIFDKEKCEKVKVILLYKYTMD